MAKAIATIGGTALVPGVSKNRRLYTRAVIAGAVTKAQERIKAGGLPLTMLTHHGAEDDSTRIVGQVRSVFLGEDGSAQFTADIADTDHGRTIATLLDSSDGEPFLKTVSIRGAWEGKVRRVTAPDNKPAEQGDSLAFMGFDFTKEPGVSGAQVDTFSWASEGQDETTERVLITESVQEAQVTISEETAPADGPGAQERVPPAGVAETLAVLLGPVSEAGGATPDVSKRGSGMQGSGRRWADPGYQKDGKQRYDITDKGVAVTAWRYIHQASKAAKYTPKQLKNVKARIRAALKGFGVKTSDEAAPGWVFTEAIQITPEVAEYYGDSTRSGSWSVSASNGPVNMSLSSWSMDPADLDVILRAAADAACKALAVLDPDMDGDVDVDGVGANSDTDNDSGKGETAPAGNEPAVAGTTSPAPAGTTEGTEDPAMGETTRTEGAGAADAAGLAEDTKAAISAAVSEAVPAAVTSALEAFEAKRAEREAASAAASVPPTTPAAEGAPAAPAAPGLTEEQRIEAAVEKRLAERLSTPGAAAATTEGRTLDDIITERVQAAVADGTLNAKRAGLVVEHTVPSGTDGKEMAPEAMRKLDDDDFTDEFGSAMDLHTFGSRGHAVHGLQPASS